MILTIHYIRGIAALLVVLFHFRADLNKVYAQQDLGDLLFGSGMAGVDLFFIISGFIIVVSTRKIENRNCLKFVIRRFFRIYPMLIVSVIAFWILMTDMGSYLLLLKSIIPLQLNYNDSAPYFGYNLLNPAWTLTYEIYFYSVFLIGMAVSHKHRVLISSLILISLMISLQWCFGDISLDANTSINVHGGAQLTPLLKISSSPMIVEFIIGMILSEIYLKYNKKKLSINLLPLTLVGISLYVILFASKAYFTHGIYGFGAWAVILIISLLAYEMTKNVKEIKSLIFLGNISYTLYITHIVTAVIISNYSVYIPIYAHASGFSMMMIYLTSSLLVAYICHIFIEKPMHHVSRKILTRLDTR